MTDTTSETIEEYGHGCRIVRTEENGYTEYHYENALGHVKSFELLEKAKLYADVHTVMGGFREEKTGERGVPPAVARAREDVLAAYLVSNPTMGVEWAARFFDVDEEVIREYTQMVRDRAAEQREGNE